MEDMRLPFDVAPYPPNPPGVLGFSPGALASLRARRLARRLPWWRRLLRRLRGR